MEELKKYDEIDTWYKIHNIVFEKVELYCDFFISLVNLIDKTYLGHDVTITEEDKLGHFRWCFNKTIDNFEKENIFFQRKGFHFEYLWSFLQNAFYYSNKEKTIESIIYYFKNVMNIDYKKTEFELQMLHNFYKILDKNLKN